MKIDFNYLNSLLDDLGFDWSNYTLSRLTEHLSQIKGRTIVYLPSKMPLEIDGVWLTSIFKDEEFVFFDRDVVSHFQESIKLHELSHMIKGDKTEYIHPNKVPLLQERLSSFPVGAITKSRFDKTDKGEIMADMICLLIRNRVEEHRKKQALKNLSDDQLRGYFEVYQ